MAKIVTVANPKGGVGKSTTTLNIAAAFGKIGYRVGVIDADPQASLSKISLARGQHAFPFDVIPSRLAKSPRRLAELEYDVVFVDTPSGLLHRPDAEFARGSLDVADRIVIPFQPSLMDLQEVVPLLRYLMNRPTVPVCGGLMSRRLNNVLSMRTVPEKAEDIFAMIPHGQVLHSSIGQRTAITEVLGAGETIFDYVSESHPASVEYLQLAKEMISWLKSAQA